MLTKNALQYLCLFWVMLGHFDYECSNIDIFAVGNVTLTKNALILIYLLWVMLH